VELTARARPALACASLGHTDILVRRWPDLSDAERRELELAENLDRKDLTAIERNRQMLALVEAAAEIDQNELRGISPRNGAGRPEEPGSLRRVAARLGVDEKTIRNAKRHVAAVEQYPELEHLSQAEALELAATLPTLPEEEQTALREALIASNAVPTLDDATDAVTDEAGKAELDHLRYLRHLREALALRDVPN
jgi:hypothetical protein